jgi:putative hydrolase of the HAD superfamily
MNRPDAILFDLDDTLYVERTFVDSGFAAVARMLAPILGRGTDDIARHLRSLHDRDGRGRLFDTLMDESGWPKDPDLVMAAVLVYRTHRPRLVPASGVVYTLDRLRDAGIRTGLVSDGLSAVQWRKLMALAPIRRRLDVVVMTDELGAGFAKPSPVPFRVACRMLDALPERTWYVANDPRKDFVGARRAGLATIRAGCPPDEGGSAVVRPDDTAGDADATAGDIRDIVTIVLDDAARSSVAVPGGGR